jgi:hypothetical protein
VCVYYCRTYYKAVRGGEEWTYVTCDCNGAVTVSSTGAKNPKNLLLEEY